MWNGPKPPPKTSSVPPQQRRARSTETRKPAMENRTVRWEFTGISTAGLLGRGLTCAGACLRSAPQIAACLAGLLHPRPDLSRFLTREELFRGSSALLRPLSVSPLFLFPFSRLPHPSLSPPVRPSLSPPLVVFPLFFSFCFESRWVFLLVVQACVERVGLNPFKANPFLNRGRCGATGCSRLNPAGRGRASRARAACRGAGPSMRVTGALPTPWDPNRAVDPQVPRDRKGSSDSCDPVVYWVLDLFFTK